MTCSTATFNHRRWVGVHAERVGEGGERGIHAFRLLLPSSPMFSSEANRRGVNLHHLTDPGATGEFYFSMGECSAYHRTDGAFVAGFSCPGPGKAAAAVYCCGFNDVKYCCDDPNSFFPYEYDYMWWLRYSTVIFSNNIRSFSV